MLAAHILGGNGDGHLFTAINHAPWVKLVFGFDRAADYPAGTKILGRIVFNNEFEPAKALENNINPEEYAEWLFEEQLRPVIVANPRIDYWETGNEHAHSGGNGVEATRFENRYTLRMSQLIVSVGRKPVILNPSVGTPDLPEHNRMELWQELLPCLKYARDNGGYLGIHEYTNMQPEWNTWLQFRYRQILPWLDKVGLGDLRILVTEFGFDNLPAGGKPWREYFGNDVEACARALVGIVAEYQKDYPRVEALFFFTFGGSDGWPEHNIDGVNFPAIWRQLKPADPVVANPLPSTPTKPLEDLITPSKILIGTKFDFVANGRPISLYAIKDGKFTYMRTLSSPRHIVNVINVKETSAGTWWQVTETYWIKARKLEL